MRTLGVPGRSAVALLAGALGVFSPLSALAQDTSTANEPWAPPPVSTNAPGDGNGQQSEIPYQKQKECVTRDLDNNIVLQEKPWGQQYLQIEQAQKLAVAAHGSAAWAASRSR